MERIFVIHADPENSDKTIFIVYDDKMPYKHKEDIKIEFPTAWVTSSVDNRSSSD